MSDKIHIPPEEEKLRATAHEMIEGYSDKLKKLIKDYPDPKHIMRDNERGYRYQAVNFIVDMAKEYARHLQGEPAKPDSVVTYLTYECETDGCTGTAVSGRTLDTSNPQPDGAIAISADIADQDVLTCSKCGTSYYTGDLDISSEHDL